jgi:protein-S-isoprenylcysteine O-methyltransferase Ste14
LSQSNGKYKIRGFHIRLVLFFSALLAALWDFVMVQRMAFRLSLVNMAGLGLFFIGISTRVVAVRTLGKYFSPKLRTLQNHRLVDYGIYKHVRHPAYLGTLLFSIGIPLIFSSLYGFLLMLALFPCYLYRIKFEERMLLEKLGDEYREYTKKTKKIIPLIY